MKRRNPEQVLQIAVAEFLGHALKSPTIWTAFPAGGGGKTRGAFLKAMGLKAGWPDMLVMHPFELSTLVIGIELKAGAGKLSSGQKEIRDALWAVGARYTECRSLDQVEAYLRRAGVPLHAELS